MGNLLALKIFLEVARHGNFAIVAKKHNIASSSISRLIAGLENELGLRLFQRTTRATSLTEAGTLYYERIAPIVTQLEDARLAAVDAAQKLHGTLRIAVPLSFARQFVVPALNTFVAKYPHLEIDLILTDTPVDLLREHIDIAVRFGSLTEIDSAFTSHRLLNTRYFACASPAYLSRRSALTHPNQLAAHNCLCPSSGGHSSWLFKSPDSQEILEIPVCVTVVSSSDLALRKLTIDGMGVSLLPTWLIRAEIENGSLVHLFPRYIATPTVFDISVWLVHPAGTYVSHKIRAFVDYINDQLKPYRSDSTTLTAGASFTGI